jgi:hypothetical protein
LNVSKPAITRALDRLEELAFARRETEKNERRSEDMKQWFCGCAASWQCSHRFCLGVITVYCTERIIARRTTNGSAYLRTLGGYITEASKQAKQ